MPALYLDETGRCLHGLFDVNLDNVRLLSPGGVWGWAGPAVIGLANGTDVVGGGYAASSGRITNGPSGPVLTILGRLNPTTPTAANFGLASGGEYTWWWGSGDPHRGLNTTTGLNGYTFPGVGFVPNQDLGLLAMGPAGEVCFKNRNSYGPCIVREIDGTTWQLTPGDAFDVQLLGGGRALWRDQTGMLTVRNLPQPLVLPGQVTFPLAFQLEEEWWLSYFSDVGFVAHSFTDPTIGWRFTPPGQNAWTTARALTDTTMAFAWASHEEATAGQVTSGTRTVGVDPLEPLLQPITRPFLWGMYAFNRVDPYPPGNAIVPIRQNRADIDPADLAYIRRASTVANLAVTLTSDLPVPTGFDLEDLHAIYVGEDASSGVSLEQAIDETRPRGTAMKRGLAVYQDSIPVRDSVLQRLKKGDYLFAQFYRKSADSFWQGRFNDESARLTQACAHAGAVLCPVLSLHAMNGALTDHDAEQLVLWAVAAAERDHWYGAHGFRAGTSDLLPRALSRFDSLCRLAPRPARVPVPPPDPQPPDPEDPDMPATPAKAVNIEDPTHRDPTRPGFVFFLPFALKEEDAGGGDFALRLPDQRPSSVPESLWPAAKPWGKYLSWTTGSGWTFDAQNVGRWQKFHPAKNASAVYSWCESDSRNGLTVSFARLVLEQ